MTRRSPAATAGPSLSRRLGVAFALVVGLIVLTGVTGVVAMSVSVSTTDGVSARLQPARDENRGVLLAMTEVQSGIRGYLLTQDVSFLEAYRRGREAWRADSWRLDRHGTGPVLRLVEHQRAIAEAWLRRYAKPVVAASERPRGWSRIRATRDNAAAERLFEEFRQVNSAVDQQLSRDMADARAHSFAVRRLVLAVLLVASTLSVALGGFAAARTTRGLVRPLSRLRATVERLTVDGGVRADAAQGPVEVRAVAGAVNALADEGGRLRLVEQERARARRLAHDVGLRIRECIDVGGVGVTAVEELGMALGVDRVYLRYLEDGVLGPVVHEWHEYDVEPLDVRARAELAADDAADLARRLWRDAESHTVDDVAAALARAAGGESLGVLDTALLVLSRSAGASALLMTPFGAGRELLGTVTLVQLRHPRQWSPAEVTAVQSISADLGRAHQQATVYNQQQDLVEKLRRLDRTKSDFLSTVSHELRTPLTSISGYVELLADGDGGPVTEDQLRMLAVIDRNAYRLRSLIEDLLTLSRIESGAFRTNTVPVDVAALVASASEAVRPGAAAAALTLEVDPGPAGVEVLGDPGQLDRVLLNLLSNAVKFTEEGGTVRLSTAPVGPDVVIRLQDTGIGIPTDELGNLFSRFFRATNATSRAIQGTGLGLTIVRSIVEHHHGTVDVRSAPGEGTTVEVRLPLAGRLDYAPDREQRKLPAPL